MIPAFFFLTRRIPSGKRFAERFICSSCGAAYPVAGTCHGFGDDKHPPTTTEER